MGRRDIAKVAHTALSTNLTFNVPVQTPTRGHPFYYTVIPRNRPIKSPFTTRWGYGGHILD